MPAVAAIPDTAGFARNFSLEVTRPAAAEIAVALFAKTVALVPAALPAPPTIETHAVKIFPNSPLSFHPRAPGRRLANLATKQVMLSQSRLL